MAYAEKHVVPLTTNSSGVATGQTPALNGRLLTIIYTKSDFADGVDFAITGATTGQNFWTEANVNASKTVCPRQPTHDNAGIASLFAAAGEPVEDYYYVPDEHIAVSITNGGDTKNGTLTFIVGG